MQTVTHDSVLLAADSLAVGRAGPSRLTVNGSQVNDLIALARAAAVTYEPRGLRGNAVAFTAWRFFTTRRAAVLFRDTHFNELPTAGDLVFISGDVGDQVTTTLAGAVPDKPRFTDLGLCIQVDYSFLGGVFTSTDIIDPDIIVAAMRLYNQAIASGAEYVDIVFDEALSAAPRGIPQPAITAPDGQPIVDFVVLESTITATGFRIGFNAAIPAAGYRARGVAFL